jgi:DNA-binding CsgD family transcriptional regulator
MQCLCRIKLKKNLGALDKNEDSLFSSKQWKYIQKGFQLTPRQTQIAKLICQGLNNNQIAKTCNITYDTARTHVNHICTKVAVHGRAELILHLIKVAKYAR